MSAYIRNFFAKTYSTALCVLSQTLQIRFSSDKEMQGSIPRFS